jgi:hypothetical protein
MKRNIAPESWNTSFVVFGGNDSLRKELEMKNSLVSNEPLLNGFHLLIPEFVQVCYSFLVDQECRIRWKGVGYAQHYEMKFLLESSKQLSRVR